MRRIARTKVALLGLVVALGASGAAHAAEPSDLSPAGARALVDALGGESAGTYLDRDSSNMVVAVTNEESAEKVRAAGGIARIVEHRGAKLERITALLGREAELRGMAWGPDPVENKVVVTLDSTVRAAERERVEAIVEPFDDAVRVERTGDTLRPLAVVRPIGGESIFAPSGERCSLGFNVQNGDGVRHFLTAGHCGTVVPTWTTGGGVTATTVAVNYPGADFALADYDDNGLRPSGHVDLYNGSVASIDRAGDAFVGQAVQKSGSTSGVTSGTVTALNQSVNYGNGNIIDGLVRTSACADNGDSGGPLFDGTTALGLVSGGVGYCSNGGETFVQPVKDALNAYGVSLQPPTAPALLEDGTYRIKAEVGGHDLDVTDCQSHDGADVRIFYRITSSPCQRWQVTRLGDNTYKIIDGSSGKALEVAGCSGADGTPVQLWAYYGGACQTWRISDVGGGAFSIIGTGSGRSLDVAGCSPNPGADVIIWPHHGGSCQRWYFDRI